MAVAGGLMLLGILVIQFGQYQPVKAESNSPLTVPKTINSQTPQVLASTTSKPTPNPKPTNVSQPVSGASTDSIQNPGPPNCQTYDACGAQPVDSSEERAAKQGVTGRITIGPTTPVCYVDLPQTCADAPYQTTMAVKNSAGIEVTRFSSKDDGSFKVTLPPGTYTIESISQDTSLHRFNRSFSQIVTVELGKYSYLAISFDSGIR